MSFCLSSLAIKLISVWALLCGVILGMIGTFFMVTAYHPFKHSEMLAFIADMLLRFVTLRWRSAIRLIWATSRAGEKLHAERRDLSLLGINFLFASFMAQTIGAAFAVWDIYRGSN